MTQKSGLWRKVASAFIEFEEASSTSSTSSVSLEDEAAETARLLAELSGNSVPTPSMSSSTPTSSPLPPPPVSPPADLIEGRPFQELYDKASIPPVAQSAETTLAILDGLASMPAEHRRMTLVALDSANPNWTLDDVIQDATQKEAILQAEIQSLAHRVSHTEQQTAAEKSSADAALHEAETTIQEQISALQAELEQFRTDANAKKAEADAQYHVVREVAGREVARLQSEMSRLQGLRTFLQGPSTNSPTSPKV